MGVGHLGQEGSIWFSKYIVMQSLNGSHIEHNLLQFMQFSTVCMRIAHADIAVMLNLRYIVQP